MDSIKNLNWRYATQKFDQNKTIPDKKIEIIKEAFSLTPTSYGLQPVRLVVVHNKTIQERLFEYTYGQKQILTASHVLVFCTETKINAEFIEENFQLEKKVRNTPDEIINRSKNIRLKHFENWSERQKEKWAVNQLYLTLGNILSICAHEGIDACPMEGLQSEKYDYFLKLHEKSIKSHLVVPIGYRAKDDIFAKFKKVRRSRKETVIDIF